MLGEQKRISELKKLKSYINLLLLLVFLLSGSHTMAQTTNWTGSVSSDWNNAANWSNGVPAAGYTAVITNFSNKPILSTSATVANIQFGSYWPGPGVTFLTVESGGSLTITNQMRFDGDGGSLHIDGGSVNHTGTSLNWGSNVNRYIEMTSGSFTTNANFAINGGNTTTQPGFSAGSGTATFNANLTINSSNKRFDAGSGTINVSGNLTVGQSSIFNLETASLTVDGTTIINGDFNGDDGTATFDGPAEVKSNGELFLDTGNLVFNSTLDVEGNGYAYLGSGTVEINNNVQVQSSGFFYVQNATVNINGDADFSSNGNLFVDNGTINVAGNASVTSGGSMTLGGGNLNLSGDFEVTGGSSFQADSSTVTFSGDSTQTITTNGNDLTFNDVVVDSGATFQTDGDTENVIIVEGNLTVNEGGSVNVQDDDKLDIQGEVNGDGAENVQSPAPFAVTATAPNLTSVVITFNKAMVESLAENAANYVIERVSNSAPITVNSATLNTGGDSRQVTLSIGTIQENAEYRIIMNNLESVDGGDLSVNHIKRFTKQGPITFYSRQNGNWSVNSTWSTVSHAGAAATKNPTNTPNSTVIVGAGHTVSVVSGVTIVNLTAVSVASSSKLIIGSGGVMNLGTKVIGGAGTFEVSTGKIIIGSAEGISSSGATGNIQTTTRIFSDQGSYTYNALSAQITGSGLPSEVNSLDIDNVNNVIATNNLEVSGTLTLTNGSFIISSGNNLIANSKTISNGDLILERTISGSNGWRLLSSPLSSNYEDLLDSTITQGYPGAFYSTGSNPGDTLQPNVLYYDETYATNVDGGPATDNQRWRAPQNATNTVPAGLGLYTYIFGDIDADPLYNDQFPLPLTLTVQGQENEGDGSKLDFGVTYTADADSGWNLIGNPFAASIDWDDNSNWTKTNIDNTIYVWDPATSNFKTWNGSAGDLSSQGLIAPFQGFWVKANAENPELEVFKEAKTFGGTYTGKRTNSKTEHPVISLKLSSGELEASTHFMFSEEANLGKDTFDAYRLVPPPGIFSYLEMSSIAQNGMRFAINNLPRRFGKTIEIPIYIDAFENGYSADKELTLNLEEQKNIPAGWTIQLIDNQTKAKVSISNNQQYRFTQKGSKNFVAPNLSFGSKPKIASENTSRSPRFTLLISPGEDAIGLPQDYTLHQNYPNPFNPTTNISFELPIQSYTVLTIFDMLGREVTTLVNEELPAGNHIYTWYAGNLSSGVYLYRLMTNEAVTTKKMILVK